MKLIHDLGLVMKTNAVVTQIRRIRLGHFTLDHALVRQTWDSENIIESIAQCRKILKPENLVHRKNVDAGVPVDNHKLLSDGENEH